jgi:hypothetical protein
MQPLGGSFCAGSLHLSIEGYGWSAGTDDHQVLPADEPTRGIQKRGEAGSLAGWTKTLEHYGLYRRGKHGPHLCGANAFLNHQATVVRSRPSGSLDRLAVDYLAD